MNAASQRAPNSFELACATVVLSALICIGTFSAARSENVGAAGDTPHRLMTTQIARRLVGSEITDRSHWGLQFLQGGQFLSTENGDVVERGKWSVRNSKMCMRSSICLDCCYEVWDSGSQMELRSESQPSWSGFIQSGPKAAFLRRAK